MVCASSLIPLRASVSLVTSMKTSMAAEVSFKTSRHKHLDRVVWEDPCLDVHLSLDGYKVPSEKSFFFKVPSRTVLKCTHSGVWESIEGDRVCLAENTILALLSCPG